MTRSSLDPIAGIEYDVDLRAMEADVRRGHRAPVTVTGLLGYSVFAYVEEAARSNWRSRLPRTAPTGRCFSTLKPRDPAPPALKTTERRRFLPTWPTLQILMGPLFREEVKGRGGSLSHPIHARVRRTEGVMAPFAEQAFDAVLGYFDGARFPITPLFDYSGRSRCHGMASSMEHTCKAPLSRALASALLHRKVHGPGARRLPPQRVAHHVAHAWIPKRVARAKRYLPFRWSSRLIDTIWLSEGFLASTRSRTRSDVLPNTAEGRPHRGPWWISVSEHAQKKCPTPCRMPWSRFSRTASTLLLRTSDGADTVFSRGGLMAYEMDGRLRARRRSKGAASTAPAPSPPWSAWRGPRLMNFSDLCRDRALRRGTSWTAGLAGDK